MIRRPPSSTLFPSPTLCRSGWAQPSTDGVFAPDRAACRAGDAPDATDPYGASKRAAEEAVAGRGWIVRCSIVGPEAGRSEEHTSELQSRQYLACRLLLEKTIISWSPLLFSIDRPPLSLSASSRSPLAPN